MQAAVSVTPSRVPGLLLGLATVRPVFVRGAPGIGKSSLVREFADSLGLECVSVSDQFGDSMSDMPSGVGCATPDASRARTPSGGASTRNPAHRCR